MFRFFKKKVTLKVVDMLSKELALIMTWFRDNPCFCENRELAIKTMIKKFLDNEKYIYDQAAVNLIYLYAVDNLTENVTLKHSHQPAKFQKLIDSYLKKFGVYA